MLINPLQTINRDVLNKLISDEIIRRWDMENDTIYDNGSVIDITYLRLNISNSQRSGDILIHNQECADLLGTDPYSVINHKLDKLICTDDYYEVNSNQFNRLLKGIKLRNKWFNIPTIHSATETEINYIYFANGEYGNGSPFLVAEYRSDQLNKKFNELIDKNIEQCKKKIIEQEEIRKVVNERFVNK